MSYIVIHTAPDGTTTVCGNFLGEAWVSSARARAQADHLNATADGDAVVHRVTAAPPRLELP